MNSPLVSICCITYNHFSFIEKAIDSFLMQETNFDFEIIINDDCSTDGTREILLNYKKQFPDKFNLILQSENQWSKGVRGIFARFTFPEARGKYIAMCEGDDYWIDPHKLQKQVDFLEQNEEYGFTCGGFDWKIHESGKTTTSLKNISDPNAQFSFGFDIELERFWNEWCVQTLTVLFKKSLFDHNEFFGNNYEFPIDVHMFYHLIRKKKGFYFKEVLGVMNVSNDGLFSHKTQIERMVLLYEARKDLSRKHKEDKFLTSKFFEAASQLYTNPHLIRTNKKISRRTLFFDMLTSAQSFNDFKHLIKCLFTPRKRQAD